MISTINSFQQIEVELQQEERFYNLRATASVKVFRSFARTQISKFSVFVVVSRGFFMVFLIIQISRPSDLIMKCLEYFACTCRSLFDSILSSILLMNASLSSVRYSRPIS